MKCSICNLEIGEDEEMLSETIFSPDESDYGEITETMHLLCFEAQEAENEANSYYNSTRGV